MMLKPPLLDPDIPEEKLAEWVDTHTMRVHQFLDKVHQVGGLLIARAQSHQT